MQVNKARLTKLLRLSLASTLTVWKVNRTTMDHRPGTALHTLLGSKASCCSDVHSQQRAEVAWVTELTSMLMFHVSPVQAGQISKWNIQKQKMPSSHTALNLAVGRYKLLCEHRAPSAVPGHWLLFCTLTSYLPSGKVESPLCTHLPMIYNSCLDHIHTISLYIYV